MPSISTLLTDPDGFFRRQGSDASLKGPLVVILAVVAVDVVAAVLQSRFMSQLFEGAGAAGGLVTALQAFTYVFVVAGPFVVWLLYAGLFHAISVVFGGDGAFSTTLSFVGWGFVPSVVGSVASAAINYYRFNVRGIDVPAEITQESMQQFNRALQTGPLVALSAAFAIVFTLWSAFLWTFALKHARDLTVRQAALTVAGPVLVAVLISLRTLLVAIGVL
ncbi:Yip1 family protein [Halosimplex halophilum]|uniref:Yip1 family protein n=1 Tax=Halosimplex halophilum TaxID=2559572 RepID=UPI00107F03DD|nr:Yip1 family protein [Halosimplex halophilum]